MTGCNASCWRTSLVHSNVNKNYRKGPYYTLVSHSKRHQTSYKAEGSSVYKSVPSHDLKMTHGSIWHLLKVNTDQSFLLEQHVLTKTRYNSVIARSMCYFRNTQCVWIAWYCFWMICIHCPEKMCGRTAYKKILKWNRKRNFYTKTKVLITGVSRGTFKLQS